MFERKTIIGAITTAISMPFLIVAYQNIEKFSESRGWDTTLSDMAATMPEEVSFHQTLWFTLFSICLLGFVIGIWVHYVFRKLSNRKDEQIRKFGSELVSLAGVIDTHANNSKANRNKKALDTVLGDLISKNETLRAKYKIKVISAKGYADKHPGDYRHIMAEKYSFIYRMIGKLLKDGHLKKAREVAETHYKTHSLESYSKPDVVDTDSGKAIEQESGTELPSG